MKSTLTRNEWTARAVLLVAFVLYALIKTGLIPL